MIDTMQIAFRRVFALALGSAACGGAREVPTASRTRCHLAGQWTVSLPLLDDNHPDVCTFSAHEVALALDTDAPNASKIALTDHQPWNFRTEGAPGDCRYTFSFRTQNKDKNMLIAFELHESRRGAVGEVTVGRGFIDAGNQLADLGSCRTTTSVELRSNEH